MRKLVFFTLLLVNLYNLCACAPSIADCTADSESDEQSGISVSCVTDTQGSLQVPFPDLAASIGSISIFSSNQSADIKVEPANIELLSYTGHSAVIPDNAFSGFKSLRELTIDFSQATAGLNPGQNPPPITLSPNAFKGLESKLKRLELINVNLNQADGFPAAIRSLSSLHQLKFDDCNLKGQLKGSDLKELKQLRRFLISGSPNLTFSDDAFSNNADTLEELYLDDIQMTNLSSSISSLKNLQEVDIRYCGLKSVPANAFKNSGSTLKGLRLENNRISSIEPDAFKGLSSLNVLVLTENQIANIPKGAFEDLVMVETLELSSNNLTSDSLKNAFASMKKLKILSIAANKLTTVTADMLAGTEHSLSSLYLGGNAVRSIRGTKQLQKALQLILPFNGIDALKPDFLESGSNFSDLILDDNPITTVQSGVFNGVTVGGSFVFDNTSLNEFDLSSLAGLKNLQNLTFSNNEALRSLKISSSDSVPSTLKFIFFEANPKFILTDPDGSLVSYIQKSNVRLVFNGQIYCSCQLGWLREKWPKSAGDRKKSIAFSTLSEDPFDNSTSIPAECCNLRVSSENFILVEDFLSDSTFAKSCATEKPNAANDNQGCRNEIRI